MEGSGIGATDEKSPPKRSSSITVLDADAVLSRTQSRLKIYRQRCLVGSTPGHQSSPNGTGATAAFRGLGEGGHFTARHAAARQSRMNFRGESDAKADVIEAVVTARPVAIGGPDHLGT